MHFLIYSDWPPYTVMNILHTFLFLLIWVLFFLQTSHSFPFKSYNSTYPSRPIYVTLYLGTSASWSPVCSQIQPLSSFVHSLCITIRKLGSMTLYLLGSLTSPPLNTHTECMEKDSKGRRRQARDFLFLFLCFLWCLQQWLYPLHGSNSCV